MPTPYPDPFSGLAQGLQQGFTMGLARRQQALAEQEQAQKIEAEKSKALKEAAFKGLETGQNLMKIKHPAIRQKGLDITMKTIRDNADFFGVDPASLPDTINWTDGFEPVIKEIDEGMKAYKEGRIDDATALSALNASLMKAKEIMDSEDVEMLRKGKESEMKAIQGGKERAALGQAAGLPPDDPLMRAGTAGVDVVKSKLRGVETPKTEYKERLFPVKGGKIQQQFSNDGGLTWQNLGEPYDRHKPSEGSAGGTGGKGDKGDKATTDSLKVQSTINKADLIIGKVDEAINQINWASTGLIGDIRSTMPGRVTGSGAYDLRKTIDTIKANVGFEQLQAMRDASKTGGALGQVAVKELDMLQSTIASLDAGQDDYQLMMNLKAVKKHYEAAKEALLKSAAPSGKTVIRTGTDRKTGKKVIQYSDGSVEYGN